MSKDLRGAEVIRDVVASFILLSIVCNCHTALCRCHHLACKVCGGIVCESIVCIVWDCFPVL